MQLRFSTFIILAALLISACKKEGDRFNQPPDTYFAIESINLSGDQRLNTIVRLTWYGTDPDGYIKGYELSTNGSDWTYTTQQDSTFNFSIPVDSDTTDVELQIRAIDNQNVKDPSPDKLIIPLKNTAPTATFDQNLSLPDTAFLVATTAWDATDLDGEQTITQVLLSINGIDWVELNQREKTISILPTNPKASDTVDAKLYYGTNNQTEPFLLKGLSMNDTNHLFIKSVDQAGVESKIDTSTAFYMKGKINDILVIGGVSSANSRYRNILNSANIDFDFFDLTYSNGINQPNIWNITFRLQLLQYGKLFFYSDETGYTNPYTNVKQILLEFAASSLQEYANLGGKYLITSYFDHDQPIDGFRGVLPIQSLSTKNYADANLLKDSFALPIDTNYPALNTQKPVAITKLGLFNIDTTDTDVFYTGQLSDRRVGRNYPPWPDTKILASARPKKQNINSNERYNQIFFSVQLWELNGDKTALINLFDRIFNTEFQE